MTLVHLCIYCHEKVDLINGEFIIVAVEWEGNPAKYAHIHCHQDYMKEVEKDE